MFTQNGILTYAGDPAQVFLLDRPSGGHIYFENMSDGAVTVSVQSSDAEDGTYAEFDTVALVGYGRGFHTFETDDVATPFVKFAINGGKVKYTVVVYEDHHLVDPRA